MEDIFKFLLVIGIIAVGFVRQAKKEANKKTGGSPVMLCPMKTVPFPKLSSHHKRRPRKQKKNIHLSKGNPRVIKTQTMHFPNRLMPPLNLKYIR